jgi:hypothetical protein
MTYDDYSNLDMQIRVTDQKVADALGRRGHPAQGRHDLDDGPDGARFPEQETHLHSEGQPQLVSNAQMGPLAMNRPRYWQVEGDVLILTTKDDNGKALAISRWKKEGATPR